ncbi:MAG TPA: hypothetical protein VMW52_12905, partial [Phycisphaerae bacterium]|nr:hypothetical protein [Phycisphaerae bacterium]
MSGKGHKARRARRRAIALAGRGAGEIFLLQAQTAESGVTVDEAAGVIGNVAVVTAGVAYPAVGDPFEIDTVMLEQVVASINAAAGGVKSRISHPELKGGVFGGLEDGIFYLVGRCRNARLAGAQVRADMHIA